MHRALAAQQAELFGEAEQLYRSALLLNTRSFDALHMLGIIRLQSGGAEEATHLLMAALPLMPADYPPFFRNLCLCLAGVIRQRKLAGCIAEDDPGKAYFGFHRNNNLAHLSPEPPLVSIVVCSSNNVHHAERALASVMVQAYPNIEIIVVNNGSQDGWVEAIRRILDACPLPHRIVHKHGLDGHALLNAGVTEAAGRYVSILNANDEYPPERIEYMVRMLAGSGARWGFSNARFVDEASNPIGYGQNATADTLMRAFDSLYSCHYVIENFLEQATALCTGNLFFERDLWQEIGGFHPYLRVYDWDFCLSASLRAEPAFLDEPAYIHRIHDAGDDGEAESRFGEERYAMFVRWCRQADSMPTMPYPMLTYALRRYWQRCLTRFNFEAHMISNAHVLGYAAQLGFCSAPAHSGSGGNP